MDVAILGMKQYTRVENSKKSGDLFASCDVLINSWLEIKNVKILRSKDDTLFVSFPQLKSETKKGSGKYRDVLIFKDKQTKKELEAAILETYKDRLLKGLYVEDDFSISITLNKNQKDPIKAWASIELEGMKIFGITIWQAKDGPLVAMPQRLLHNAVTKQDDWVDLIYPTNSYQKKLLMDKIIDAYDKEKERLVQKGAFKKEQEFLEKNGFQPAVLEHPFMQVSRGE